MKSSQSHTAQNNKVDKTKHQSTTRSGDNGRGHNVAEDSAALFKTGIVYESTSLKVELKPNTNVLVRKSKDPNTAGSGSFAIKLAIGTTSPTDTWHPMVKVEHTDDQSMVAKRANTGRNLTGYCFRSLYTLLWGSFGCSNVNTVQVKKSSMALRQSG